jgi:hypothetical protein
MTGGITTKAKKITKRITDEKIAATAEFLDNPRFRNASTAGFKPVARNRAISIKTNIWLALARALIKTIAVRAPRVAIKPK